MPPPTPYDWTRARNKWESSDPFYTEGAIVCEESPPGGAVGLRRRAETGGWKRGVRGAGAPEPALPPVEPGPLTHRLRELRLSVGMVTLTTLMRLGVPLASAPPVQRVRVVSKPSARDDLDIE
jgi:hypothetical protein